MNAIPNPRRGPATLFARGLLSTSLCLVLAPTFAAPAAADAASMSAEVRYRADRAACVEGRSGQSVATCLKEAGAALATARSAARQPRQGTAAHDYSANALTRCERLPDSDRDDCRLRMQGHGSQQGSVAGGGILYEMVTKSVGAPPRAASAP